MAAGASEIDPPDGVIDSQDRPGISRDLERNTLVLSRVLFQSKDNIEVEEIYESIVTLLMPRKSLHQHWGNHPVRTLVQLLFRLG